MGYVYYIFNTVNNKIYIGSTVDAKKRRYFHWYKLEQKTHHNKPLQCFVNKYGIDTLCWEIVYEGEGQKDIEQKLILEFEGNIFNTALDVYAPYKGKRRSEESIEKGRQKNLGKKLSDEHKRKISESGKGRVVSNQTKDKISKAHKGRKHSEEFKRKCSEIFKGRICSEESNKKRSETHKKIGKSVDWYEKNKISVRKHVAKLTSNEVLEIKFLLHNKIKGQDIARLYKVAHTNISSIKNGHSWSDIILTSDVINHFNKQQLLNKLQSKSE